MQQLYTEPSLFYSISELVKHEENSLVFNNETELAQQIMEWFRMGENNKCNAFKNKLKEFQRLRWHENWMKNVYPLINEINY